MQNQIDEIKFDDTMKTSRQIPEKLFDFTVRGNRFGDLKQSLVLSLQKLRFAMLKGVIFHALKTIRRSTGDQDSAALVPRDLTCLYGRPAACSRLFSTLAPVNTPLNFLRGAKKTWLSRAGHCTMASRFRWFISSIHSSISACEVIVDASSGG